MLGAGILAARGAGASSADPVGLLLTLGAVLGYVLYVEAAQHAIQRGLDAAGAMAGMFGVGAILLAPVLALEPLGWLASPRGAVMALHLGVVTIGVAYTLYGWGLRCLAVPTVVTLTLAEPLTAAILGTAVLGERLGRVVGIGRRLGFRKTAPSASLEPACEALKQPLGLERKAFLRDSGTAGGKRSRGLRSLRPDGVCVPRRAAVSRRHLLPRGDEHPVAIRAAPSQPKRDV